MTSDLDQSESGRRRWFRELRVFIVLMVALFSFRSSVADWYDVPTQSMEPTILVGERIAVFKAAYDLRIPFTDIVLARWDQPDRGDIVVLDGDRSGKRLVKRVIGVPGDRIELRGGRLIVNGVAVALIDVEADTLDLPRLTDAPPHEFAIETLDDRLHLVMALPARRAPRDFGPVTVPAGRLFVMGDNRDNSRDSRIFGMIPRDELEGRVFGVAASVDTRNGWRPRWTRFFSGLD